jgi:hypothetical protein
MTAPGTEVAAGRSRGRRRRGSEVSAAALLALVTACASADESSFTSLAAADAQARAWVDTAVVGAISDASVADGHSEGPDSCTTSPDFAEMSYSLSVDVPADEVDGRVAAIWRGFREQGFGTEPIGTAPAPAGPGSPSWTLNLFHDGFRVEITGARTEPTYVSTYIITPCLRTA